MARAIGSLLVMGLLGMFVLSLLFSVLMPLMFLAVKVAIVLVIGYVILRIVSPGDAEKIRVKFKKAS
ncbi:MAG: hypothetical protein OEM23_02540 [Gemmatimonadota bacterium]|nr:hypothetical protein [Gemmatimonadota bacterium]MDH3427289.1 hypothetical protein [Gemmatimonadota bacterium]